MEILYALSVAVLVILFATLLFIVLRARSKDEESLRELRDAVALLRGELTGASPLPAHAPTAKATAPTTRPAPHQREPLPVTIVQPLVVKLGDEVIELDADTVARIEALTEDVNEGRIDGTMLRRLIDAGLTNVGEAAPPSGRKGRAPEARSSEGESDDDDEDDDDENREPRDPSSSDEPPITPTRPTRR